MGKRRIKKLATHFVGALDGRSVPVAFDHRVTNSDSMRFRVQTSSGLEVEATFQVMGGVFSFAGRKPSLIEVGEAVEEFYAMLATDRPLVCDRIEGMVR